MSLDDLHSHKAAWRTAIEVAIEKFEKLGEDYNGDVTYWRHELNVFDKTFADLPSAPQPEGWLIDVLFTIDQAQGMSLLFWRGPLKDGLDLTIRYRDCLARQHGAPFRTFKIAHVQRLPIDVTDEQLMTCGVRSLSAAYLQAVGVGKAG